MLDDKNVQNAGDVQKAGGADADSEGTTSQQAADQITTLEDQTEGAKDKKTTTPQTFSMEQVQELVKKEMGKYTETAKRELQNVKDKHAAEINKLLSRSSMSDTILNRAKNRLAAEAPDLAKDIELSEAQTKLQYHQNQELTYEQEQRRREFDVQFREEVGQFLSGIGIDPNSPEVDWGDNFPGDYIKKLGAVHGSISKKIVSKTNAGKGAGNNDVTQVVKDVEAQVRKNLGLDSVDTTRAASQTSDDKWLDEYSDGKHDSPQDDLRAKNLIDKMLTTGG